MALSENPVEAVRQLQAQAADLSTRRTTAEAHQAQAQEQLQQILAAEGVTTVEELQQRAEQAAAVAQHHLAEAAKALGMA